jgi:hypothetical protein
MDDKSIVADVNEPHETQATKRPWFGEGDGPAGPFSEGGMEP